MRWVETDSAHGSKDECVMTDLLSQIQEIGMGWYQWQLFIVVGFGWANDNLWPIVTSLICEIYWTVSLNGCSSTDLHVL